MARCHHTMTLWHLKGRTDPNCGRRDYSRSSCDGGERSSGLEPGLSAGCLRWQAASRCILAPPAPPQPWADLPKVLELARRPNAVIKVSGACTLSREPYPFPDIWDPLARVFDAWGFDRCLWGTDWTRRARPLKRTALLAKPMNGINAP